MPPKKNEKPEEVIDEREAALNEEIDAIPVSEDDKPDLFKAMESALRATHEIESLNDIVLKNSLTDAAIENARENSQNPDIRTPMKEREEMETRIGELEEEIKNLRNEMVLKFQAANMAARKELEDTVNTEAREKAEKGIASQKQVIGAYLNLVNVLQGGTVDGEMVEWLTHIRQRAGIVKATNGGSSKKRNLTPAQKDWNDECRNWASATGKEISSRGRIPESVQVAFTAATGKPYPNS